MIFVYLDEFGHIGPYVGRGEQKYNESPVFGLAGLILPEQAVRPFATFVLKQKQNTFAFELDKQNKMAAKWEKKGTSFIRPKQLQKFVEMRRLISRILTEIVKCGGNVFYYGREKERDKFDGNPNGLYTTCLAHSLRKINALCTKRGENFVVVLDQHSARKELLECAAKTMYGSDPCWRLSSPPFEVESYLNQNIQAADWIATLVGRLAAFEVSPNEFRDLEYIKNLFGDKVSQASTVSELMHRPRGRKRGASPFDVLELLKRRPQR